jgi:hypothetical protein
LRDFRLWWALFVFFAILSVLAVQYRYRRWRRAGRLLTELAGPQRTEQERRVRLEGWRLVLMTLSVLSMTGVVFAVLLGAPTVLVVPLRVSALLAVLGVLLLSLRL